MDCFRSNFEQVAPSVLSLAKEKKGKVLEEVDTFLSVLDCNSDIDDDQEMEPAQVLIPCLFFIVSELHWKIYILKVLCMLMSVATILKSLSKLPVIQPIKLHENAILL